AADTGPAAGGGRDSRALPPRRGAAAGGLDAGDAFCVQHPLGSRAAAAAAGAPLGQPGAVVADAGAERGPDLGGGRCAGGGGAAGVRALAGGAGVVSLAAADRVSHSPAAQRLAASAVAGAG